MNNNDVELNALLGIDSTVDNTNGASAEKVATDETVVATSDATNNDTSKRAQDRIRELNEEVKRLKETQTPKNDNWLDTIQDEGTKELLKRTIEEAEKRVEAKYKPVLSNFQDSQFEKDFAEMQAIFPNLSNHKDELKKDFSRNPNSNLKSMVGNLIVDLQASKIKPLESKAAQSPREGQVDINLDTASKEDLYAMLKAKKNN